MSTVATLLYMSYRLMFVIELNNSYDSSYNYMSFIVLEFYKETLTSSYRYRILYYDTVRFINDPLHPLTLILRTPNYATLSKGIHYGSIGADIEYVIFRRASFSIEDLPLWERKVKSLLKKHCGRYDGGKRF